LFLKDAKFQFFLEQRNSILFNNLGQKFPFPDWGPLTQFGLGVFKPKISFTFFSEFGGTFIFHTAGQIRASFTILFRNEEPGTGSQFLTLFPKMWAIGGILAPDIFQLAGSCSNNVGCVQHFL